MFEIKLFDYIEQLEIEMFFDNQIVLLQKLNCFK